MTALGNPLIEYVDPALRNRKEMFTSTSFLRTRISGTKMQNDASFLILVTSNSEIGIWNLSFGR